MNVEFVIRSDLHSRFYFPENKHFNRFSEPLKLLIFCLLIMVQGIQAQTDKKPLRIELDSHPNSEPFQFIPLGSNGLLVILKTNEIEEKNLRKWGFGFYDTDMELQWEFFHSINRNYEYSAYARTSEELSLFYYDHKSSADNNTLIININNETKQLRSVEGSVDKRYEPFVFVRQDKFCYLGSNAKTACKLFRIDTESGEISDIKLNESGGVFLENICIDTLNNEIAVLTSMRNERRQSSLYLQRLDTAGNQKAFIPLMKGENRKILTSADYVSLGNGMFMVLGSFTVHPQRRPVYVSDPEGAKATGFYRIISESDINEPSVQFFSFGELSNFETYMRGTTTHKNRRSIGSLFGSKTSDLEHSLIIHKIEKYKNIFLLLAEAFTSDYRNITTIVYDYYGRPIPRTYSVFDGYRYRHAMVLAFDRLGRLIWDNGIEMSSIRTFTLAEKAAVYIDDNEAVMAYSNDGKIAWKPVKENHTGVSYANIETKYSKDRVTNEQNNQFTHWYDNYFLASGYQTIVNNYLPSKNQRSIFFINKIAFD